MNRYKAILIFGSQGSGKSTQVHLLCDHALPDYPAYYAIDMGEEFRRVSHEESERGERFRSYIEQGILAPVQDSIDLIKEVIEKHKGEGYKPDSDLLVIDGVPRAPDQVDAVNEILDIAQVISLKVDHDTVWERIKHRMQEEHRTDDNKAALENRLKIYHDKTLKVLAFYEDKIAEVDASKDVMGVHKEILGVILR